MPLPNAAKQLIAQVDTYAEHDNFYRVTGERDGYGRHREVTFDAATAKWLTMVLRAFDDDRISQIDDTGDGLVVTFVSDVRADSNQPYPFDEVLAVFDEDEEGTDES